MNTEQTTRAAQRRASILREMGLGPVWRLRRGAVPAQAASAQAASAQAVSVEAAMAPPQAGAPVGLPAMDPPRGADDTLPTPDNRVCEPSSAVVAAAPASAGVPAMDERAARIACMRWQELRDSVAQCQDCALHRSRQQAVLGVGDEAAEWLFVGEGPGAEEDRRGEPFVGPAGQLLDAMLAAMGLARGDNVYIANAVKCRPPNNETPKPEEMDACRPYLERQIALIQPRLIVALGRPAAQTLLGQEVKIAAARGRRWSSHGHPLVVTYHPAYLLRNLGDKAKAWEDLCLAREVFAQDQLQPVGSTEPG